jgi:thiol-disulfide isomerase/thioredoxin
MLRRMLLSLSCGAALAACQAHAAPATVERFEQNTWQQLQHTLPRPAAVVFTATYCASCLAVLAQVNEALRKHALARPVIAVVIDESSDEALLSSHHYTAASRLFRFADNEARLRYRVDPRWRGETPYVVLLSPNKPATFIAGMPNEAQINAWLGRIRGTPD